MNFKLFLLIAPFVLFSCKKEVKQPVEQTTTTPNIIYILADDLGYNQIGAYGSTKIETPNLDQMAKDGMVFSNHYTSAPVCAPDRCMLLTGLNAGKASIRGNDEWAERGDVWNYEAVEKDINLEGQRPMPDSTFTIAKMLKNINYKTAIFGKWGLGGPGSTSTPNKMGFDYFYGYNCQRQAHNYYPLHLFENEKRVALNNDTIYPHKGWPKGLEPNNIDNYKKYTQKEYAPDLIYNKLESFVEKNQKNPFFIYWATPIPHTALQAPKKWLDYYHNKFGDEKPYYGKKYFPQAYPHAAYAAMVSYFDENIGKLIDLLKRKGIYDNTLIIFTSDNGPAEAGGTDTEFFNDTKPFPNAEGKGKGSLHEGGIRTPMIATWKNKIKPGSSSDHISVQYDVMATLGQLVDYKDKIYTDGISFLPTLLSKGKQDTHEFIYWEFPGKGGQVALRMGAWKFIIADILSEKPLVYQLYNLDNDPSETKNVASQHPEIVDKAIQIIKQEHKKPANEKFELPIINKLQS
ncbi:arylsulfatase [Tenacibaculum sp. UWU-22]|uniref:arylsulfatase n=1 Tax=Tenacibaculum sp. UWU-22 TaxID=3234187 RepID=UPI0034DAE1B5